MSGVRRGPSTPVRVLVGLLVISLVAVGTVVIQRAIRDRQNTNSGGKPYPAALVSELAQFLDSSTGLFFDPTANSPGPVDLVTSAYAQVILRTAGREPLKPDPASLSSVQPQLTGLTRAWAISQLDPAAQLDADAFEEYFGQMPSDDPDKIGYIAVLVSTWCSGRSGSCPAPPDQAAIEQYLNSQAAKGARQASPYLEWKTESVSTLAGLEVPPVSVTWTIPSDISETDQILDVCGAAQLQASGRFDVSATSLMNALRPYLSASLTSGAELEASNISLAWLALGGQASDLNQLATQVEGRLDPNSGLVRAVVSPIGTIHSTYEVAAILSDDFPSIVSDNTAQGLRAALTGGVASDIDQLTTQLEAAVALDRLGDLDATVRTQLTEQANSQLASIQMTEADIPLVVHLLDLVTALGGEPAKVTFPVFSLASEEDQSNAFTALTMGPYASNWSIIQTQYCPATATASSDASGYVGSTGYLVSLYYATFQCSTGTLVTSNAAVSTVVRKLNSLAGCQGERYLLRGDTSNGSDCSLDATREAFASGLRYVNGQLVG